MTKRSFGAAVVTMAVATMSLSSLGMGLLKDPFAGTWKITLTPEGGGKDMKETLNFQGDTMTANTFKTKGWEPGTYDADTRGAFGGMATFTATLKNPKTKGTMNWSGQVNSGQIKGDVTIKVEGKSDEKWTYTGER